MLFRRSSMLFRGSAMLFIRCLSTQMFLKKQLRCFAQVVNAMLVEILGQVHQREHISKVVSDQLSFQLFWRRKRKLRGHRNWREERAEAATIKFEAYKGCSQHSRSHNQDGFKWTKCYKVVNCGPTSQWLHCGIVYTSISISGPPRVACEHIMNPAPFQCFFLFFFVTPPVFCTWVGISLDHHIHSNACMG